MKCPKCGLKIEPGVAIYQVQSHCINIYTYDVGKVDDDGVVQAEYREFEYDDPTAETETAWQCVCGQKLDIEVETN